MEAKKRMVLWLLLSCCIWCSMLVGPCCSATIEEQCSSSLTKVTNCLGYSTGKEAEPSETCCSSTKEMRKDQPACLCFFIQQTFKGVPQIKQLGVKVDKLLRLPADCKLTNTSVAECPKLLNLAPTAPEYALFTNSSTPVAKTTNSTGAAAGSTTSARDSSSGPVLRTGFGSSGTTLYVMAGALLCLLSFRP